MLLAPTLMPMLVMVLVLGVDADVDDDDAGADVGDGEYDGDGNRDDGDADALPRSRLGSIVHPAFESRRRGAMAHSMRPIVLRA